MILCICNNLNTRKVDDAIVHGARTPKQVLAHHGKAFNCGQCKCEVKSRICAMREMESAQLIAAE